MGTLPIRGMMSEIAVVITDGTSAWKLSWIKRTSRGFYLSFLDPGNPIHISYHEDGEFHLKRDTTRPVKEDVSLNVPIIPQGPRQPLTNFYGVEEIYSFILDLSHGSLSCLPIFKNRRCDGIFCIETRYLRTNIITVEFKLMSRNFPLPLNLTEPHSALYYFATLTTPWLVICVKEGA